MRRFYSIREWMRKEVSARRSTVTDSPSSLNNHRDLSYSKPYSKFRVLGKRMKYFFLGSRRERGPIEKNNFFPSDSQETEAGKMRCCPSTPNGKETFSTSTTDEAHAFQTSERNSPETVPLL